jgi:hypothetical protein
MSLYSLEELTPLAVASSLDYLQKRFNLPMGPAAGKPIDIATMKAGWCTTPIDGNWPTYKDDFMQAGGYPVATTVTASVYQALAALQSGYDVEVTYSVDHGGPQEQVITDPLRSISYSPTSGKILFEFYRNLIPLGGSGLIEQSLSAPSGSCTLELFGAGTVHPAFVIESPRQTPDWQGSLVYEDAFRGPYIDGFVKPDGTVAVAYAASAAVSQGVVRFAQLLSRFHVPSFSAVVDAKPAGENMGPHSKTLVVDGNPACLVQEDFPAYGLEFCRAADAEGTAWGAPVRLDDGTAGNDYFYNFAGCVTGGLPACLYTKSTTLMAVLAKDADGTAWNAPVAVAGLPYALDSQLAQDALGMVTAAWRNSSGVSLLTQFDFATATGTGPQAVAAGASDFCIRYDSAAGYGLGFALGADSTVGYISSPDAMAWSTAVQVSSAASPADAANPGIVLAFIGGQPALAWYGQNDGTQHFPIWFCRSTDGGQTWGMPELVATTSASFDPVGKVALLDAGGRPLLLGPDGNGRAITAYEVR